MMQEFYSARPSWGCSRVFKETIEFDRIVRSVYEESKVSESVDPPVAIFAYGSPGRFEFAGGDSDADILIAEPKKSEAGEKLKKVMIDRWSGFDFSKIDVPPCSTYEEIDDFLRISLVEGNQVLGTRFICGSDIVRKSIEEKKKLYDSVHREVINIVFNRLYFDQYFSQRVRNGAKNIKYCKGGTRDFLPFYWYDRLCRKIAGESTSLEGQAQSKVKQGLERLLMEGALSGAQFGTAFEAVNGLIELRTDTLIVNRATEDRGLSVLDSRLISRLQRSLGYPEASIVTDFFDYVTGVVSDVVDVIWDQTIMKGSKFYGASWAKGIESARSTNIGSSDRLKIPDADTATKIVLLWGATNSGDEESFNSLAKRYSASCEWGVVASIACSPLCNTKILHDIGTGIAKEPGYGYILRIVGRNSNVHKDTLKSIAEDPRLEKRYSEVAATALELGATGANNLI